MEQFFYRLANGDEELMRNWWGTDDCFRVISLVAFVVGVQLALLTLAGQQAGAEGLSADRCPQGIGPIEWRPNEIRILGGNDRQRIAAGSRHRVRLYSANQPNQIFQWLISGKSINYLELLNHLLFLSLAAREIPETLIFAEILSVLDRLRHNGAQRLWQHESDDGTNQGQDSKNGQWQKLTKTSLLFKIPIFKRG